MAGVLPQTPVNPIPGTAASDAKSVKGVDGGLLKSRSILALDEGVLDHAVLARFKLVVPGEERLLMRYVNREHILQRRESHDRSAHLDDQGRALGAYDVVLRRNAKALISIHQVCHSLQSFLFAMADGLVVELEGSVAVGVLDYLGVSA